MSRLRGIGLVLIVVSLAACSATPSAPASGAKPGSVASYFVGVNLDEDMAVRNAYLRWYGEQFLTGLMENKVKVTFPDPASIEVVRFVEADDQQAAWAQCLNDAGYPVEIVRPGEARLPAGSYGNPEYLLADYTCFAQYPPRPNAIKPLGREQWARIYDDWVKNVVPCLDAAGYPQKVQVPSVEVFVENNVNPLPLNSPDDWYPWSAAATVSTGTGTGSSIQLREQCPQKITLDEIWSPASH